MYTDMLQSHRGHSKTKQLLMFIKYFRICKCNLVCQSLLKILMLLSTLSSEFEACKLI